MGDRREAGWLKTAAGVPTELLSLSTVRVGLAAFFSNFVAGSSCAQFLGGERRVSAASCSGAIDRDADTNDAGPHDQDTASPNFISNHGTVWSSRGDLLTVCYSRGQN